MKRWIWSECDEQVACRLAVRHGFPPAFARVMVVRGLIEDGAIERFLNPRLSSLSDPMLLPGMTTAVDRIWRAVDSGERIVVFGDYDVDGITSAALLQRALSSLGGNAGVFLPDRVTEGYGFTVEALRRCMDVEKASLLITVDCGTNDVESVRLAHELGADVIKCPYTGSAETFARVVDGCPVPVVIAGGSKLNDEQTLEMIEGAVKAGAAGLSIGRNVFQHENPELFLKAACAMVHQGLNAKEAMEML